MTIHYNQESIWNLIALKVFQTLNPLHTIRKVSANLLSSKLGSNFSFMGESVIGNNILKLNKFVGFPHAQINKHAKLDK